MSFGRPLLALAALLRLLFRVAVALLLAEIVIRFFL